MNKKYQGFNALSYDRTIHEMVTGPVVVFSSYQSQPLMGIDNNKVSPRTYLTKQMCMDFFGLVDPTQVEHIEAAPAVEDYDPTNDKCFDVLYLDNDDASIVRHTQYWCVDKQGAIGHFRVDFGSKPYIVSVAEHAAGLNNK